MAATPGKAQQSYDGKGLSDENGKGRGDSATNEYCCCDTDCCNTRGSPAAVTLTYSSPFIFANYPSHGLVGTLGCGGFIRQRVIITGAIPSGYNGIFFADIVDANNLKITAVGGGGLVNPGSSPATGSPLLDIMTTDLITVGSSRVWSIYECKPYYLRVSLSNVLLRTCVDLTTSGSCDGKPQSISAAGGPISGTFLLTYSQRTFPGSCSDAFASWDYSATVAQTITTWANSDCTGSITVKSDFLIHALIVFTSGNFYLLINIFLGGFLIFQTNYPLGHLTDSWTAANSFTGAAVVAGCDVNSMGYDGTISVVPCNA